MACLGILAQYIYSFFFALLNVVFRTYVMIFSLRVQERRHFLTHAQQHTDTQNRQPAAQHTYTTL
jgi:hypothetical protein